MVGSTLTFFAVALFARDWGEAALQSASLAIVLGVVCLLTGLVYLVSGLRRHWLAWLVAGALFTALGVYELPMAVVPLRFLQAQVAADGGRYDEAYTELRLAGVPACDLRATDTLLAWAGADQRAGRYGDAVARLRRVAHDCPATSAAQNAREQIGAVELAWGEQLVSTGDYADAVAQFAIVERDYAKTPLAPAARQNAAAAYVAWADGEEHEGQYGSALAHYQLVLGTYPESPYVDTARNGAAQTLFDWGQWATRTARYDDAVQHFSALVDLYPASPQAIEATTLLAAPQLVVGRLVHSDGSAVAGVAVRLASEWEFGGGSYTTAGARYSAITDATGIFVVVNVPPGSYLFEWVGSDGRYTTFVGTDGQPEEIITVPRLHPLTLDNIDIDPSDP